MNIKFDKVEKLNCFTSLGDFELVGDITTDMGSPMAKKRKKNAGMLVGKLAIFTHVHKAVLKQMNILNHDFAIINYQVFAFNS